MVKIQRIYDISDEKDSFKILVDRIWPRGITKERAGVDLWMKEIAPSNELRKWFAHDPQKWDEFQKKYFQELGEKRELIDTIVDKAEKGNLVLLYGAKDKECNNAVALKSYLESKMNVK